MEFFTVRHPRIAEPAVIPESAWEPYYQPLGWERADAPEPTADGAATETADETPSDEPGEQSAEQPKSKSRRRAAEE